VPLLNIATLTLVDIRRHSSNIPDSGVYSLIELGYTGEATCKTPPAVDDKVETLVVLNRYVLPGP